MASESNNDGMELWSIANKAETCMSRSNTITDEVLALVNADLNEQYPAMKEQFEQIAQAGEYRTLMYYHLPKIVDSENKRLSFANSSSLVKLICEFYARRCIYVDYLGVGYTFYVSWDINAYYFCKLKNATNRNEMEEDSYQKSANRTLLNKLSYLSDKYFINWANRSFE